MNTATDANMESASSPSLVPRDKICLSCHYDLTGLAAESPCPECSMPIADSLRPAVFVHSFPSERRHISDSIRFLGLLFAVYPLLVLFVASIGDQMVIIMVPLAWIFSIAVMSGLTRPELIDPFGVYPRRRIMRCTIFTVIGPLPPLTLFIGLDLLGYAASGIAMLMCLLVPAQCAAALAFSSIAFIARDPASQRRNRHAAWIVLVFGLLLGPIYLGPIIAGAISFCAAWPLARSIGALRYEPRKAGHESPASA